MHFIDSKEFCDLMKFFEEKALPLTYIRGTKEKENREYWLKQHYYKNGQVNDAFMMFLSGYQYGKIYNY